MTLRLAILSLALAAVPLQAAAQQTSTVSGTVTNRLNGDPVAKATVTIESTTFSRQSTTDSAGKYSVANVPPGMYHVIVRLNQFLPERMDLTVAPGTQTADVLLIPELHFSEVTSVSPEGRSQFESFQATDVLGGQELTKELQGTLGATIENEPGIALRSFGPGPARPVIRGLDGDRVLIVEDGLRMGDLSSQSGDHGVNVNPASASSIEVVRGPATLLYGANAIGGLVNVITNDIPRAPVTRPTGSFTLDAMSGAPGGGAAGDVTLGNGTFAVHLAGSGRRSNDFKSPDGDIPNSFNRAGSAEIGAGYTSERGYLGASYAWDKSHYGIPFVEAGQTNLDPRRQNVTVRGETRNMGGFFDGLRGSFGVRRYKHDELDGEEIATSFINNTTELELLGHHRRVGRMSGSIGGSFLTRNFSAAGEEALSPEVDQRGGAVYLYEEVAASQHVQVQFGGRVEHSSFEPKVDEPARDFTNLSGSVGLLFLPTDRTTIAFSLAHASRNPALEELYFHGPHPGNNAIENGNPDLDSEHSLGFDASLRWRSAVATGEVTFFVNRIDNFIFRQFTGEVDEEEGLAVTEFAQADGRLAGVESHLDVKVGPLLWVEGGLDYVRGDFSSSDTALPRIPPLRGRAGLRLQKNAFQAGVDGIFTAKQDRVYALGFGGSVIGETPTDGYNLMKVFASYTFGNNRAANTITARLDNATNALYRNHLNYLKDLAPEMGRNFAIVYSVKF
ncbi:MAG TPA: TonB-dependent receptor [Vicinamibacterales bacterium]|jgi:iron complex outermembrane receptor protein|nr:TonB-dependent receptor [Vicinamibacterales bacterium]